MLKNDLILRVFKGQSVERTPVWLMRQAGRTDPLYQQIRQNDRRPLEEIFCDIELSTKISLLPERMGVDAIIMFQDILTPLNALGIPFYFRPAPRFEETLLDLSQVQKLQKPKPKEDWQIVGRLIQSIKHDLDSRLPILGFAGAPVTLSLFLMAGQSPSNDIPKLLQYAQDNPVFFQELLNHLTDMTIEYVQYQIQNGIDAFQIFESFAEHFPKEFYEQFALPTHQKIFDALPKDTPAILFAKEFQHIDLILASGAKVLSLGTCFDLRQVYDQISDEIVLQGNISNVFLRDATEAEVEVSVNQCLQQGQIGRHILNLSHGLLPDTPFVNVLKFIAAAKQQKLS